METITLNDLLEAAAIYGHGTLAEEAEAAGVAKPSNLEDSPVWWLLDAVRNGYLGLDDDPDWDDPNRERRLLLCRYWDTEYAFYSPAESYGDDLGVLFEDEGSDLDAGVAIVDIETIDAGIIRVGLSGRGRAYPTFIDRMDSGDDSVMAFPKLWLRQGREIPNWMLEMDDFLAVAE